MVDALTVHWQNPSSVHRAGQAARQRVELARQSLANLIGCRPRSIVMTSGGTESIDLAIRGAMQASRRRVLVTSPVEHAAVRDLVESMEKDVGGADGATPRGVQVRLAELDSQGRITARSVERLLDESVGLVSLQWANNETGVVHPVHEIGAICRAKGVVFHCDGTQWVGKLPTRVDDGADGAGDGALRVDLLTFSPHKFHGPKGVGVLYARPGIRFRPQICGVQELGRRGGTENVPGIVGAGVAAELALAWLADEGERSRLAGLRDRLERLVMGGVPDARVNGVTCETSASATPEIRPDALGDIEENSRNSGGEGGRGEAGRMPAPRHESQKAEGKADDVAGRCTNTRLWNTTSLAFPRLEAEALLLLMSEKGLCASAGAACSSGSLEPSPVLLAMGIAPELAHGSVRFSLSRETTQEEIDAAAAIVVECVQRLRRSMTGSALP